MAPDGYKTSGITLIYQYAIIADFEISHQLLDDNLCLKFETLMLAEKARRLSARFPAILNLNTNAKKLP